MADGENMDPSPLATLKLWSPFSSWSPMLSFRQLRRTELSGDPVISTQQCMFYNYGYSYQYIYYSACI